MSATIRINIGPSDLVRIADYLRSEFDGRPELIVAEDTRAEAGGFTLRYFFELPGRDSTAIVSMVMGKDERSFPSLATRWYLASLFEREIHDLFGLKPLNHPDLRRLLLPDDWQGHALRKDFPLRGYEPYSLE